MKKLNILFICKYNRFRSKIAEAYFKKTNKNKDIKSKSAGLFTGNLLLNNNQINITKEFNINIIGKPRPITIELLKETNLIIIVADNVPSSLFELKKNKKIIVWNIKDVNSEDKRGIKRAINQIILKVNKLNESLESRRLKW